MLPERAPDQCKKQTGQKGNRQHERNADLKNICGAGNDCLGIGFDHIGKKRIGENTGQAHNKSHCRAFFGQVGPFF